MLQHVHHSAGLNAPARTLGLQYERLRVVFLCAVDRCDRPFPLLGGSGTVSMETTLRLRAKDYAAHDRWLVNIQAVVASALRQESVPGGWRAWWQWALLN